MRSNGPLTPSNTKYVPAVGTVNIDNSNSLKRKSNTDIILEDAIIAKRRKTVLGSIAQGDDPLGMIWDSQNYSCAYDSVFTILGDIWVYNPTMWTREFNLMSSFANKLGLEYQKVSLQQENLENARNTIRKLLHNKDPVAFPYGKNGVDMSDLLLRMFTGKTIGKILYNCTNCGTSSTSTSRVTSLYSISRKKYATIQEHIDATSNKTKKCTQCGQDVSKTYKYNSPIRFQAIGLSQQSQDIEISKSIKVCSVVIPIRGAIYYSSGHFVCRIISPTGEIWYHDGIETRQQCVREGYLADYTEDSLRYQGTKICIGVIYAL